MQRKGAINIDRTIQGMIGILLITILAFTWFFPTLNSSDAINNSTTLELGGTNYSWFIPVVIVLILFAFVLLYYKGMKGGT